MDEFHATVLNNYRSIIIIFLQFAFTNTLCLLGSEDSLVIGFCGLRTTTSQEETLSYVLCSSYFGNCGKQRYIVYSMESKEIECWTSFIKYPNSGKIQYYCDTSIPFNLEVVKKFYLKHREADAFNPVFDPVRHERR